MKKLFIVILSITLLFNILCLPAFAETNNAEAIDEAFKYSLINREISNLEDGVMPTSDSSNAPWYNIDPKKELPRKPVMNKYDYSEVKRGDVLYEAAGFFGLTGHVAIVAGWEYDATYDVMYILLIESVQDGVCYGYLDDERLEEREGTLYHVDATDEQIETAFSIISTYNLMGKPWGFQANKPDTVEEIAAQDKWQCSTLVWAIYYQAEIDLEQKGLGTGLGVTPHDIRDGPLKDNAYLTYQ